MTTPLLGLFLPLQGLDPSPEEGLLPHEPPVAGTGAEEAWLQE